MKDDQLIAMVVMEIDCSNGWNPNQPIIPDYSSWKIMEVIEKIISLGYLVNIENDKLTIIYNPQGCYILIQDKNFHSLIYKGVLEFAQWLQKRKNHETN